MKTFEVSLVCKMRVKASTPQKAMIIANKLFDNYHVSANQCTTTWQTADKPLKENVDGLWKIEDPK